MNDHPKFHPNLYIFHPKLDNSIQFLRSKGFLAVSFMKKGKLMICSLFFTYNQILLKDLRTTQKLQETHNVLLLI